MVQKADYPKAMKPRFRAVLTNLPESETRPQQFFSEELWRARDWCKKALVRYPASAGVKAEIYERFEIVVERSIEPDTLPATELGTAVPSVPKAL